MPFPFIVDSSRLIAARRRHRRNPDAVESPTDKASQNPVHDTNHENNFVLRSRKISKKNIHQRDGAEHDSQTEPPDNPAANPNMDVIHKFSLYVLGRAVSAAGLYCPDRMP